MGELAYHDEAAAEYDKAFAHVSRHFLPFLMRAARVAPGMRVLDVATGTGLAAEEALLVVGTDGHVVAADLSDAMVEQAKRRLGATPNITFAVEDGQSLSFEEGSFDALICSLGLMFFPAPARGLSEFLRVLRPGGRAAASVLTVPERSYNGRINTIIANTGLHADQARRHIGKADLDLTARPLLTQHNRATRVVAYDMERVLADIDTDGGNRGLGGLRHGVLLVFGAPCRLL